MKLDIIGTKSTLDSGDAAWLAKLIDILDDHGEYIKAQHISIS